MPRDPTRLLAARRKSEQSKKVPRSKTSTQIPTAPKNPKGCQVRVETTTHRGDALTARHPTRQREIQSSQTKGFIEESAWPKPLMSTSSSCTAPDCVVGRRAEDAQSLGWSPMISPAALAKQTLPCCDDCSCHCDVSAKNYKPRNPHDNCDAAYSEERRCCTPSPGPSSPTSPASGEVRLHVLGRGGWVRFIQRVPNAPTSPDRQCEPAVPAPCRCCRVRHRTG